MNATAMIRLIRKLKNRQYDLRIFIISEAVEAAAGVGFGGNGIKDAFVFLLNYAQSDAGH